MRGMLTALIFLGLSWQAVSDPVCPANMGPTVGTNDPHWPQILPASFQTRIEANFMLQGYSVLMEEFVDTLQAGYGRINIYKGGNLETVILNYNTNETYHIIGQKCTVKNLAMDDSTYTFTNMGLKNMPHMYTTQHILRFAQQFGEVYKGRASIRGISCDHFQTCRYWPNTKSNFTLDYYFSVSNWTTAMGDVQIPVRAEVKGISYVIPNSPTPFHHIYDYVTFSTGINDPTVFETPKGVPCVGRKNIRKMPMLAKQYRYREELVDPIDGSVRELDIWYDSSYKLVRYDYRPTVAGYPYYSTDAVTQIHDFSTGVAYAIDKLVENCTIMPIENSTWDAVHNNSASLMMKSPEDLFHLDSSFAYAGQRSARGILCDVYTGIVPDFSIATFGRGNTSLEIYYMTKDWTGSNDIGINVNSPDEPVRLLAIRPNGQMSLIFDFFDFDQEHANLMTDFDITNCYSDMEKIDFKITFPAQASAFMQKYKIIVQEVGLLTVAQTAKVSPIRVQKTEIHWDEDNIYFICTLVERAPPIAKFRRSPGKVSKYQNDVTKTGVSDAYTCANMCDQQTSPICNSFDICPGSQICSFSSNYTSDGRQLANSSSCDHFARVLNGQVDHEVHLNDAYNILKDIVYKGGFVIQIKSNDVNKVFRASSITDSILRNPMSKPSQNALKHFTGQSNKMVKGFDDLILTQMSIDDCAQQCTAEIIFTCNSFEFCYDSGQCVLSHLHPDDRPDTIQNSQTCDLYIRDYTAKFEQLPGTTLLSGSDTIYQSITSANQCAKLCTDYNSFACRSFDYCPDIQTCFLGRTHRYDVPKGHLQQNPTCSQYSRNYADDFKKTANKVIHLNDNRIVVGVSVQQCAKLCVQEETFSCASFDYCGNKTECRLSTAAMSNVGQVTTDADAHCDVYQRQYYPNGKTYVAPPTQSPQQCQYQHPSKDSYSGGAMAGLAIGMIILGILLGIGALFGYFKFSGKTPDEMVVSFSNKYKVSDE